MRCNASVVFDEYLGSLHPALDTGQVVALGLLNTVIPAVSSNLGRQ